MATIVLKKKPTVVSEIETKEAPVSEIASLIDELGAMQDKVAKARKLVRTYDAMMKKLRDAIDEAGLPADETTTELGEQFQAEIGEKGMVRNVKDKARIREFLGEETFMELVQFRLGDLDDYLDPKEREEVIETTQTGTRSVKITKREA